MKLRQLLVIKCRLFRETVQMNEERYIQYDDYYMT